MSRKALDRQTVEAIGREAVEALKAVAAKYGVQVRGGAGKFDATQFTKKIEFFIAGSVEEGDSATTPIKQIEAYKAYAAMYGLKPEWLNESFSAKGDRYKIVGLDMNRPKNCVQLIRLSDNTKRICPADFVKAYMR